MEELKKLNEAFMTFNLASETLREYYQNLQQQVTYLSEEVQRKNAELQRTLSFLNSVLQGIKEAIIVLDSDGKILMMNRAAEDLLTMDLSASTGHRPEEYGYNFSRLDQNNQEIEIETGGGRKNLSVSLSDVLNGGDGLIGFVILLRDITAQKEIEAEKERNKRLIAMGEMMASIVHELRNPLCSIELYASMLYKELEDTPHASLAMGVSTGVRNLNNSLSNMLYFARPRNPKTTPCDIRTLTDDALALIKPVMESRGIVVEKQITNTSINGDSGLVKQVILNILLNAVQAMGTGGKLTIHSETDSKGLHLNISDTGSGITLEHIERIFDPFFTTRDEGTGLGLSISLKIMQAHGGTIRAKSLPGSGSVFVLCFPHKDLLPEASGDRTDRTACLSPEQFLQKDSGGQGTGDSDGKKSTSRLNTLKTQKHQTC
ncbi:MAG TPA: PAS domain-containing protein [Nitrospirae bacterium]|nr:PAS domain-containing protein [Nitrospirota bacterium]